MMKMNSALWLLILCLSLFAIPVFAQNEKPPQTYVDAMDALRQADYKRAADHFRQAIAERPSMVSAHYYLGLSLYKQEAYGEALDAYQELVRLDPNNILAHYQIAKIHLMNNDYSPAVEEYRWLKSLSEKKSDAPAEVRGKLMPDKFGEPIGDWQKQYAGELAQYLLDLIPRETAEQFQLPASQIVYAPPLVPSTCLKPASRPSAPGDLNQKPPASGGVPTPPSKPSASGDSNQKIRLGSSVEPMSQNLRPTILYREKAKYTEVGRINAVQGTVALSVVFSQEGTITDIRVTRCLPDGLTQNAIAAAQAIRFNPAVKNGTPVSVRGTLEFSFNVY
jgi:TonB family protein